MSSEERINQCSSSIIYRSVNKDQEYQAIDLWKRVFEPKSDGYFERYFSLDSSPEYIQGDTLGAWSNNDVLVSIVHIRRMYFVSNKNERYLCGVISNVGTDPKYRSQGLSRKLLQQAIEKMKNENFHFSVLGTGQSHHYSPLGFQSIRIPTQYLIHILDHFISDDHQASWISSSSISFYDQLFQIYSRNTREYQYDRNSPLMFKEWIGWHWRNNNSFIYILPNEKGYVLISQPDGKGSDRCLSEWRASDADSEQILLNVAAMEIHRRYHRKKFYLHTYPQYLSLESFQWNSNQLVFEQNEDIMILNIHLEDQLFQYIKEAFQSKDGRAAIWPGEYF